MVYVIGVLGFVLGFLAGQLLLLRLLNDRTNREITTDSGIKWTYGLLNWIVAGAGSYVAVVLYRIYFG